MKIPSPVVLPFFALVLLLSHLLSAAPDEPDSASVLAADSARVEAMVNNDVAGLAAALSDRLSYGHSDGRVQNKEQLLAALGSNRTQYKKVHYTERRVHPVGDARAVTGVAAIQVVANDSPLEFTIRFLAVYIREGETWKLAAYQSTQVLGNR